MPIAMVEFPSADGAQPIYVEISPASRVSGAISASTGDLTIQAGKTFEEAVGQLRPIAEAIAIQMQEIRPDEWSVEFGLKFTSELRMVIAAGKGEGSFAIKLSWKRRSNQADSVTKGDS